MPTSVDYGFGSTNYEPCLLLVCLMGVAAVDDVWCTMGYDGLSKKEAMSLQLELALKIAGSELCVCAREREREKERE